MNNLSLRAAAKIAGLSHTAVQKAAKSGKLTVAPDGKISLNDLTEWLGTRAATHAKRVATAKGKVEAVRAIEAAAKQAFDAVLRQVADAQKALEAKQAPPAKPMAPSR